MDIITTPPYEEMQSLYAKYYSLDSLGNDITNKFALISLVCYLTDKIKSKKPDWTHWKTLYAIDKGHSSENFLKGLAVVCSDFSYGCTSFPTFDISDKDIPGKIKELLDQRLPF
jgi:hypothetical protein